MQRFSSSDPHRLLKGAISLGILLLVVWVFTLAISDSETTPTPVDPHQQARIDSLRTLLGRDIPDSRPVSDQSLLDNALPAFLLLLAMLGLAYFWLRRQAMPNTTAGQPFPIISEQDLGNGQRLLVLDAHQEYWILGGTPQHLSLIEKLPKHQATWLEKPQDSTNGKPFASILSSFRSKKDDS